MFIKRIIMTPLFFFYHSNGLFFIFLLFESIIQGLKNFVRAKKIYLKKYIYIYVFSTVYTYWLKNLDNVFFVLKYLTNVIIIFNFLVRTTPCTFLLHKPIFCYETILYSIIFVFTFFFSIEWNTTNTKYASSILFLFRDNYSILLFNKL